MIIGILVLCVVIVLVSWVISVYNGLVQLKVRANNAWADIDVQLKRRYDVIPNIVAAVEGYAKHERTTLQSVIEARTKAMSTTGVADKGQTENFLSNTLKSLFAVAEKYPDLKANENFLKLQTSLIEIEETIQSAIHFYETAQQRDQTIADHLDAVQGRFGVYAEALFQIPETP